MTVQYLVDGNDFKTFGITVSASKGVVDMLKMKPPFTQSWDDQNGDQVDLSSPRFQARSLSLDCWMKADNAVDFLTKVTGFIALFQSAGTHRLQITVDPTRPLVYEVYLDGGVQITKAWNASLMVGTFTLTLTEPEPVKRVIKFTSDGGAAKTCTVNFTTPTIINIYWGDGTNSLNEIGTSQAVSHDFTTAGDYIVIISGIIDNLQSFSTNGTVIWNKL